LPPLNHDPTNVSAVVIRQKRNDLHTSECTAVLTKAVRDRIIKNANLSFLLTLKMLQLH
jgi:hypothetical protein